MIREHSKRNKIQLNQVYKAYDCLFDYVRIVDKKQLTAGISMITL